MSKSDTGRVIPAKHVPKFTADFAIDGHSHIQSGATAPLPLLWDQVPGKMHSSRDTIGTALSILHNNDTGSISKKTIEGIAERLAEELTCTYRGSKLLQEKPYKDGMSDQKKAEDLFSGHSHIFSPVIIMPMDMDFAHIAGFPPESSTIYHEGKLDKWDSSGSVGMYPGTMSAQHTKITVDGVYYYDRQEAPAPENKGALIDVSQEKPEHQWKYQSYFLQHKSTINAVKANPWKLIPMFHYDPRRWCRSNPAEMDKKLWTFGPWDYPFKYIATLKSAGMFIGFKMYPPLGYKPLDPRLPNLEKFYARCEAEGIPILSHTSPGGMGTHEAKFYHKIDKADLTKKPLRIVDCTYDPCSPVGYFYDEYVHPKNWRPVLMKFPKLKLCLAHFGGREWDEKQHGRGLSSDWVKEITNLCDPKIVQGKNAKGEILFDNVYTDLSCYDLEKASVKTNVSKLFKAMKFDEPYKHLQDKILFGVDWYLTLATGAPAYEKFVNGFIDTMTEFDEWQWYRSALVNPVTFYGLDVQDKIDKVQLALEKDCKKEDDEIKAALEERYIRMSTLPKQVETIRKELDKAKK